MRSFTCLTALTLALALGACGGEGDDTTTTNTTKTTPSTMSDGTTTAATDATSEVTTSTSPTTTTDGTTTDAPTTDATTTDATTTAATDGTTTDATTTAATDGTTTGGGADNYGPCAMAMPPCEGAQDCLMVTDVEGNFCSPKCSMEMDCPAPPAGVTAMPQCVLTSMGSMDPTNCALICNPMGMGECPEGMTCKPIQGVGICSAP